MIQRLEKPLRKLNFLVGCENLVTKFIFENVLVECENEVSSKNYVWKFLLGCENLVPKIMFLKIRCGV
jgi:hypothetical protein